MSILLDTGILVGAIDRKDPHHARVANVWASVMRGDHGRVVAVDDVYVETMNYLARKPRTRAHADAVRQLRFAPGTPITWIATEPTDLTNATTMYFAHFDRGLSMTDCLLIATARRLEATIATLDSLFAGLAPVAG